MEKSIIEQRYRETAAYEPHHSPWGTIDGFSWIANGAYSVSTPSHGGIMIHTNIVDRVLSKEAQSCGFRSGSFLCFEEDCDAPVAIRELLDKGLMKAPINDYYKKGEYSNVINDSLKRWHPDYWQVYEQKSMQRKSKDREER